MLALLVAAAISTSAGSIDPKAQAVLDAAKVAAGGAAVDAFGPYELDETIVWHGLKGTEVALCDPRTGAYSYRVSLGLYSSGDGFDGSHVWTADSTGDTRDVDDQSDLAAALRDSYLCAFAYWYPDRMPPAKIEFEGINDLDGRAADQVSVNFPDGDSLVLSFDHENYRLVSVSSFSLTDIGSTTTFYSDLRAVNGVLLPFHSVSKSTRFGTYEFDRDVRNASVDQSVAPKLAFVNRTPDDSSINDGTSQTSFPFEWSDGLIYLKARIDGHGPYRFLLDSGRANHVTARLAAQLHLNDAFGKIIVDDKTVKSRRSRVTTIEVGGATLSSQPVVVDPDVIAFYYGGYDGGKIDGILGYEFLRRFVTTLDFETRTITLSRTSTFKPEDAAHAVPFVFDGFIPRVAASVGGKAGNFAINTNLQYSIVANAVWTEHNEPDEFERNLKDPGHLFIFGPRLSEVQGSLKRVDAVTIDGLSARKPVIIFSGLGGDGWAASEFDTAGDIGVGLLSRFVVTLDYQTQTLWLTATSKAASPEIFDRSGILVTQGVPHGDGLDVIRGSPADSAGIKSGETVLAINGSPVADWDTDSLHRLLSGAIGTKITLKIGTMKHDKLIGTRTVTIALRDYI